MGGKRTTTGLPFCGEPFIFSGIGVILITKGYALWNMLVMFWMLHWLSVNFFKPRICWLFIALVTTLSPLVFTANWGAGKGKSPSQVPSEMELSRACCPGITLMALMAYGLRRKENRTHSDSSLRKFIPNPYKFHSLSRYECCPGVHMN